MPVSKRLRYEVLRRDDHTCRYCGAGAPDAKLTVDHVVPVALGGTDTPDNLVTACADCNAGKSSATADAQTVADVVADADRWAAAMVKAAAESSHARDAAVGELQTLWDYWIERNPYRWTEPPADWQETASRFRAAGLTMDDLLHAAEIASFKYGVTQRNRWRYFAGVCNGMLRNRQERARELLEQDTDDTH